MNAENRLDARLRSTLEQQAVGIDEIDTPPALLAVVDRSARRTRRTRIGYAAGRRARGRGGCPRGCGHRPERPPGPAGTGDTHAADGDVAADADRGRAVVRSLDPHLLGGQRASS